jgi:nitrite reductase/ring-hydroxylating ferredoxin subunit
MRSTKAFRERPCRDFPLDAKIVYAARTAMDALRRRSFLARLLAGAGLAASYGLLGVYALGYLFPPPARRRAQRLFIGRISDFAPGTARPFVDQRGRALLIVAGEGGVRAFETRCPHLGCQVHWEAKEQRFFCPCHNGVFDRDGVATAGPPAAAGQSLARATLAVDPASGTIFLEA